MTRSERLQGRVLRNLRNHGLQENQALEEEIYGELTSGQDNIISSTDPDRILFITLKEDVEYYPLTTDTVTDPELTTYKNNISSVKIVKQPDNFTYPFDIVDNVTFVRLIDGTSINWAGIVTNNNLTNLVKFIKVGQPLTGIKNGINRVFTIPEYNGIILNSEEIKLNGVTQIRGVDYSISGVTITILHNVIPVQEDSLTGNWIERTADSVDFVESRQPLLGTIIGTKLRVHPIPDEDMDGTKIELLAYQKSSAGEINKTNEPELDEEYDKFLEYYATAQFLIGKDRDQWEALCEREKNRLKRLTHKKRGTVSRPQLTGWW